MATASERDGRLNGRAGIRVARCTPGAARRATHDPRRRRRSCRGRRAELGSLTHRIDAGTGRRSVERGYRRRRPVLTPSLNRVMVTGDLAALRDVLTFCRLRPVHLLPDPQPAATLLLMMARWYCLVLPASDASVYPTPFGEWHRPGLPGGAAWGPRVEPRRRSAT